MKILEPKTHAVLDYGLAALFLLAPTLFDFSGTAATLSYMSGVVYVAASLLTKYPLGLIRLIPFPVHGVLESIMAAGWIVAPWLAGFADVPAARNFFVIAGLALLGVVSITDYRSTPSRLGGHATERRHTRERRQFAILVAQERRMAIGDRRGMIPG